MKFISTLFVSALLAGSALAQDTACVVKYCTDAGLAAQNCATKNGNDYTSPKFQSCFCASNIKDLYWTCVDKCYGGATDADKQAYLQGWNQYCSSSGTATTTASTGSSTGTAKGAATKNGQMWGAAGIVAFAAVAAM